MNKENWLTLKSEDDFVDLVASIDVEVYVNGYLI